MTIRENRTLREARETAAVAEQAWKQHRAGCVTCVRAQRQRVLTDMCVPGWKLYRERRDANAALEEERRLAKQPVPGQGELFPELHA